ncbi:MAG: dihydropteroate synthase [Burkholderiaceae bacterium]
MERPAPSSENAWLRAGRFRLMLDRALIMGIVNLTPDSFSDGGRFDDPGRALAHAQRLTDEGADILDLGAESSRPGAPPVPADEQWRRLAPVLARLAQGPLPVSVDTRDPEVMRRAIDAGAAMINDIGALCAPGALDAVAGSGVALCMMHMRGDPLTMQTAPVYRDVVSEVGAFLQSRVAAAMSVGVARERLVVDPGIGFGKTLEHNLALMRAAGGLAERCGVPVLVGVSRKSTLGALTGRSVNDRLAASVAAALAAVVQGARLVRVHDVAATNDAMRVWQAVCGPAREP